MTTTGDDGAVKPLSEMIAELKPLVDANPVELLWAAIGRGEISVEIVSEIAVALRAEKATLTAQLQAANVELTALREALRPFAEMYRRVAARNETWDDDWCAAEAVTCGDIRRAAAALTRTESTDG